MKRPLGDLGSHDLGHSIKQGAVRRTPGTPAHRAINGRITSIRQFLRDPSGGTALKGGGKAVPHPMDQATRWTSVLVEVAVDKNKATTREILAESTAEVDVT